MLNVDALLVLSYKFIDEIFNFEWLIYILPKFITNYYVKSEGCSIFSNKWAYYFVTI